MCIQDKIHIFVGKGVARRLYVTLEALGIISNDNNTTTTTTNMHIALALCEAQY